MNIKFASVVLSALISTGIVKSQNFITKWDLSFFGSNPTEISFDAVTTGVVNYSWTSTPSGISGAGNFSGNGKTIITGLPANNIVTLSIDPINFKRFIISNYDQLRLIDISQWGAVAWTNMQFAYFGCLNLQITATDIPNLSGMNNMQGMFCLCKSLNTITNINNWNTSSISDISILFSGVPNFNQNIGNWNTSNVINMAYMFADDTSFNQNIGNWNTNNVQYMHSMFDNSKAFNQNIGSWNTDNVTDMSAMFRGARSFNQNIGNWNITNVANMSLMFTGDTSFNQNLGSFVLNPFVDLTSMLDSTGMDCSNYSATLQGWANQPNVPTNRTLGANSIKHGTFAIPFKNSLISPISSGGKGWTIIDGGNSGNLCAPVSNTISKFPNNYSSIFSISPNPSNGIFNLRLENNSRVIITDALSHEIYNKSLNSGQHTIALNSNKGLYFIKVIEGQRQSTKPLIIN
jgi:surface protein